jgi:multiple sugar transport system substrate-binding protein
MTLDARKLARGPALLARRFILTHGLGLCGVGAAGAAWWSTAHLTRYPTTGAHDALQIMGNPYNEDTYRRLVAAYAGHGSGQALSVDFSARDGNEVVRALLLRAFTGGRLPDVAFLNGDVIRIFAERSLLAPLDAQLRADHSLNVRATQIGSSHYGIFFGLSVPVVAFNSDLVQLAGGDPNTLPCDWAGVLDLARKIEVKIPHALGGFIEHDNGGAFTFLYLLGSYGVQPMSDDERRIAFDSPAGLQALTVLQGFGHSGQAAADMSRRQARRAFAEGRIGVLVTMSSVVPYLEDTSRGHFAVRVTALPRATAHAVVPAAGPVAVIFAKDPERTRASWEFIRFATGPRAQAILTASSGYLPAFDLPAEASPTRRLSDFVQPERVIPWYTFPGRNSLKIADLIQDEMQQIATLQKTPQRALASMLHEIEPLLEKVG